MTADERIEALVSRFGQTIGDLHAPGEYFDVGPENNLQDSMTSAIVAAVKWSGQSDLPINSEAAYICHLADIIDRMEAALETATLVIDCGCCAGRQNTAECAGSCDKFSRVHDVELIDQDFAHLYNPFTEKWDDEALNKILMEGAKTDE